MTTSYMAPTTITQAVGYATQILDSTEQLATSEFAAKGHQWVRNYVRAVAVGDGSPATSGEEPALRGSLVYGWVTR